MYVDSYTSLHHYTWQYMYTTTSSSNDGSTCCREYAYRVPHIMAVLTTTHAVAVASTSVVQSTHATTRCYHY